MIRNRPASLLADPAYRTLPKAPLAVDWSSIPELIRISMLDLSGIQPVTKTMWEAAGGILNDKPSAGEVELFRKRGMAFQLVSVVFSLVAAGELDGISQVRPFAVTLIPASKRDKVSHVTIDFIERLDFKKLLEPQPAYHGYDPFSGRWSLYGTLPAHLDDQGEGFLDEFGIVVDQFFLATDTTFDEILMMDLRMPSDQMKERYEKHRKRLLFTPFERVEARRVWGVETPIELFLIQALAQENLFPESQMLIMENGTTFPSWYHLWQDPEFRHSAAIVTEADLYFPAKRVAVFCDGTHHSRAKQKKRDAAINAKLEAASIRAVRVPSSEIKFDLPKALARVTESLA